LIFVKSGRLVRGVSRRSVELFQRSQVEIGRVEGRRAHDLVRAIDSWNFERYGVCDLIHDL
jgi:hypothetical protein